MAELNIDHKQVLQEIDVAAVKEELAIPVYTSHIKSALFWSGLSEKKKEKILEGLETLSKESQGHVTLLNRVKELYMKKYIIKE